MDGKNYRVQRSSPREMIRGQMAMRIMEAEGDVGRALRTYDTLQKDQWKQLDSTVKTIVRQNLVVAQDLRNTPGILNPINNIGILLSEWQDVSDIGDAQRDMMGLERGENQGIDFGLNAVPIPITHMDFDLPWRQLQASAGGGATTLDTRMVALATRKVSESIEDLFLYGDSSITLNGNSISGIMNHTNVVTGSLTDGWNDATNRDPVEDVIQMKKEMVGMGFPEQGPYNVYVPSNYSDVLENDYKQYSERTYRQRILAINGINDVKVAHRLNNSTMSGISDDEVVMVYMSPEQIAVDQASDIQPVEWDSQGGFVTDYKVFSAVTLRLMPDYNGTLGIVVYSDTP